MQWNAQFGILECVENSLALPDSKGKELILFRCVSQLVNEFGGVYLAVSRQNS